MGRAYIVGFVVVFIAWMVFIIVQAERLADVVGGT